MLLQKEGLKPVTSPQGRPAGRGRGPGLVVMAPAGLDPALAQKSISGFIVAEPFNAAAELKDIGRVARNTSEVWNNHACRVIFMREKDLDGNPVWSQKVLSAVVKAQLRMRSHRRESASILSADGPQAYSPFPRPALERVLTPSAALEEECFKTEANIHRQ